MGADVGCVNGLFLSPYHQASSFHEFVEAGLRGRDASPLHQLVPPLLDQQLLGEGEIAHPVPGAPANVGH